MKKIKTKFAGSSTPAGTALIMVVVLTVLLAAIGVMFVLASRVNEMSTSSITANKELYAGIDTVVNKIKTTLVTDLFGTLLDPAHTDLHLLAYSTDPDGRPVYADLNISNEPWDAAVSNFPLADIGKKDDQWLASIEPRWFSDNGTPANPDDDLYGWLHITDLYGDNFGVPSTPVYYDPTVDTDTTQWDGTTPAFSVIPYRWVFARIITDDSRVELIEEGAPDWSEDNTWPWGARADADGDGVADSRWIQLPNISTSKGEPILAAVRIIDNCAMLNLNTAHTGDPNSEGRFLSSVDYISFLRGREINPSTPQDPNNIRKARKTDGTYDPLIDTPQQYHQEVIMNIENPGPNYNLFDIGDELEIRNRYMLTSKVEARFEHQSVANYTLDAGGGMYAALEIPRTDGIDSDGIPSFTKWKWRVEPTNFEDPDPEGADPMNLEPYKYDRRHVCTFYSFDRNLRRRQFPLVDTVNNIVDRDKFDALLIGNPVFMPEVALSITDIDISSNSLWSRKNIVHLLYAFRAYFLDRYPTEDYKQAARRSAQLVANMIDYLDNYDGHTAGVVQGPFYGPFYYGEQANENPTYIDRAIVKELIYDVSFNLLGLSDAIDIDVDSQYDFGLDAGDIVYGYERQPFISELYCNYNGGTSTVLSFSVELCNPYTSPNGEINLEGWRIQIGSFTHNFVAGDSILQASSTLAAGLERLVINISDVSDTSQITSNDIVELQRPDPANPGQFITVDKTEVAQMQFLLTDGTHSSKRDDNEWKFADSHSYTNDDVSTLGAENGVNLAAANGYQVPVANDYSWGTLLDFEKVLFIGSEMGGSDPNTITEQISSARGEGDVRFNIADANVPPLLEYVSLMNRPMGSLPGRININSATKEVIRAAIPDKSSAPPPEPSWDANVLAGEIVTWRNLNGPFQKISDLLNVPGFKQFEGGSAPNVGDPALKDFEERDWILSRVANIFTVRSDVFTAYILVRLGQKGAQKRMIAIFDRSNVFLPTDNPKLVALHPVPDPR